MKECDSCLEEKPLKEFRKNQSTRDKYSHTCKECEGYSLKKIEEPTIDCRTNSRSNLSVEQIRELNKKHIKERKLLEPAFRIRCNLGIRMSAAARRIAAKKSAKTLELLGCTPAELKNHIESKFTEGMSWDNYGKWHIDHIRPCASFDLRDPQQQKECFHYTNLQPLWAIDNLKKSDKY